MVSVEGGSELFRFGYRDSRPGRSLWTAPQRAANVFQCQSEQDPAPNKIKVCECQGVLFHVRPSPATHSISTYSRRETRCNYQTRLVLRAVFQTLGGAAALFQSIQTLSGFQLLSETHCLSPAFK